MALETTNYIRGLIRTNPTATDQKKNGDDHLRLLKTALLNSFVGFPGTVMAAGTDTGVANSYVLTPDAPLLAYSANMVVFWLPANANGGASTIAISGLAPQSIKRIDGSALVNGDIQAGNPIAMLYTGTEFRMTGVTMQYVSQLVFSGVLPGQAGNAGKILATNGTTAFFTNTFFTAMDESEGTALPASSTLNLTSGVVIGNFLHVSGSATINLMTLPAGAARTLVFDGVNTLTNSGSLILPGGVSIVTAPDDVAIVRGEGAGVTRVVSYQRATGRPLAEQSVTTPGLYLLATVTPTAVAAIDFLNVFNSTYDDYQIVVEGVRCSVAQTLLMRLAQSGVVDAGNNYTYGDVGAAASLGTEIVTSLQSTGRVAATISVLAANASTIGDSQYVMCSGVFGATATPGSAVNSGAVHQNANAGAVTGFRLYWGGGTFQAGGVIRVYGMKKA